MKRHLVLLAFLALSALAAAAGKVDFPCGVSVRELETPEWAASTLYHGTHHLHFEVLNPTAVAKAVRVSAVELGVSGSVVVAPGAKSVLALRFPHRKRTLMSVAVSVSGEPKPLELDVQYRTFQDSGYYYSKHYFRSPHPVVGLSPSIPEGDVAGKRRHRETPSFIAAFSNAFELAAEEIVAAHYGSHSSHHSLGSTLEDAFRGIGLAPERWPDDWTAYSAFDALVVETGDFAKMPPAARKALRDYADAGGCVAFLGEGGELDEAAAAFPMPTTPLRADAPCGFGRVLVFHDLLPASNRVDVEMARVAFARQALARTSVWQYRDLDPNKWLQAIPVPNATGEKPVAAIIALLAAFFVLGGPVAVFVLARANRRLWIYWLLPAFSAVVSGAILLVVLLREGTAPNVRLQSATLLDQPARRATTLGAIGIYAPVGIRGGLEFAPSQDVTPLAVPAGATVESGARQRYSSAWAPARTASFFQTREVLERHERLLVEEKPDGTVEVVNALGAPIASLRLRASDGILYEAAALAPGERRALARSASPAPPAGDATASPSPSRGGPGASPRPFGPSAFADSLFLNFSGKDSSDVGWTLRAPPDLGDLALDKGTYCAILDGSPFLASPLTRGTPRVSALSVVLGRYR